MDTISQPLTLTGWGRTLREHGSLKERYLYTADPHIDAAPPNNHVCVGPFLQA